MIDGIMYHIFKTPEPLLIIVADFANSPKRY